MLRSKQLIILLLSASIISSSCVSRRKMTYLQYSSSSENILDNVPAGNKSVTPATYKIMPYDNLFIRVITPDPQWSEIFNTSGGGGALTAESAVLFGYVVDELGNIEIPFVGEINVRGKTLPEIQTKLDSTFEYYLKDASISVKLINNYVSIIGEVRMPGRYPLSKDKINIFEAISLAGDLTEFSDRKRIQVVRPSNYGPIIKELSLLDRSVISSEYYYIMPNDIIYVQPMRGRTFQMNSSVISVILSSAATLLTLLVFVRAPNL